MISATGYGEGGYVLRVVDKAVAWAIDKIAITSLPYKSNGSNVDAQSVFGSDGYGAVLYSLQCPADAGATIVVFMVSAESGGLLRLGAAAH